MPKKSDQQVFIKKNFRKKIDVKKIVMTTGGPVTRKIMTELLEECGAKCRTAVSGETDLVICQNKRPSKLTKKLKDAVKFKTPVVEYKDVFSQPQ